MSTNLETNGTLSDEISAHFVQPYKTKVYICANKSGKSFLATMQIVVSNASCGMDHELIYGAGRTVSDALQELSICLKGWGQ